MVVRVPDGMSSVEAFMALYENARVLRVDGSIQAHAVEVPKSPWNAIQIFHAYCHKGHCEYVRGRVIRADLGNFPYINADGYDKQYGPGAAAKAMASYQKTKDPTHATENFELHSKPCAYFTAFWKQKTPEDQRKDLEEMFKKCAQREEVSQRIEKQGKQKYLSGGYWRQRGIRWANDKL